MNSVRMLLTGAAFTAVFAGIASAQEPAGKWIGTLKAPGQDLPLVLIVTKATDGALSATLESTAQAPGHLIPVDAVTATDTTLTFSISALLADYKGDWNTEARVWVGTFTQGGTAMKLTMTRGSM